MYIHAYACICTCMYIVHTYIMYGVSTYIMYGVSTYIMYGVSTFIMYGVSTYIMYGVSVLPSNPCPGLILVHDLTNRKTHSHLTKWLTEFHNSSKGQRSAGKTSTRSSISHSEPFRYCTVCLSHLVMPHPLTSPCDVTLCDLSTHVTRPVHTCHMPACHVHTCHMPCPHAMSTHVTCPVHTCHMPCPHMSHAMSIHITCPIHICHMPCHMPCSHLSHAMSHALSTHVTHTHPGLYCSNVEYDPEQFVDQEVPLLLVGTKQVSQLGAWGSGLGDSPPPLSTHTHLRILPSLGIDSSPTNYFDLVLFTPSY